MEPALVRPLIQTQYCFGPSVAGSAECTDLQAGAHHVSFFSCLRICFELSTCAQVLFRMSKCMHEQLMAIMIYACILEHVWEPIESAPSSSWIPSHKNPFSAILPNTRLGSRNISALYAFNSPSSTRSHAVSIAGIAIISFSLSSPFTRYVIVQAW